jgi:hypothetical protein
MRMSLMSTMRVRRSVLLSSWSWKVALPPSIAPTISVSMRTSSENSRSRSSSCACASTKYERHSVTHSSTISRVSESELVSSIVEYSSSRRRKAGMSSLVSGAMSPMSPSSSRANAASVGTRVFAASASDARPGRDTLGSIRLFVVFFCTASSLPWRLVPAGINRQNSASHQCVAETPAGSGGRQPRAQACTAASLYGGGALPRGFVRGGVVGPPPRGTPNRA